MLIKTHLAWPAVCPLQYAPHVEQQKPAVRKCVPFGVLIEDIETLARVNQKSFNDLQEIGIIIAPRLHSFINFNVIWNARVSSDVVLRCFPVY